MRLCLSRLGVRRFIGAAVEIYCPNHQQDGSPWPISTGIRMNRRIALRRRVHAQRGQLGKRPAASVDMTIVMRRDGRNRQVRYFASVLRRFARDSDAESAADSGTAAGGTDLIFTPGSVAPPPPRPAPPQRAAPAAVEPACWCSGQGAAGEWRRRRHGGGIVTSRAVACTTHAAGLYREAPWTVPVSSATAPAGCQRFAAIG